MLRRTGDTFELHFDIKGHIVIPCDRCLDDMELPVETEDTLYVKFGEEYSEEGENLIVVPEAEGTINLAWYMYECIALTIPLKHTHPEGMCNPEMETLLKAHSAASDEISGDEEPVDPRLERIEKTERKQITKPIQKWHILKEDNRKREQPKEELMIKLWLQLWQFVLTVVLGMYTILYVESVVITEENWQSKKKLRFKLLSISMYGPKAI